MSHKKFQFRGLMAPVFTGYKNDDKQTIDLDIIKPYVQFLKSSNVNGVLVNGTSGEGMSMTVAERKLVTEVWSKECRANDITLMVQIGGCPFADVIDLAAHSEKLGVDAILCLPELYFKPKTEEALVDYFKQISKHCPNTALLYYHIPAWSCVTLSMPRFLDLVEQSVPNFVGIKYTNGDLDQGSACLKPGRFIFLGADTILTGALALGFDSTIMTTLNICPEISMKIMKYMAVDDVKNAQKEQRILNERIKTILKTGNGEWVSSMKKEFNSLKLKNLDLGKTRKPL